MNVKDIQNIVGISLRSAYTLMKEIKQYFNKGRKERLTIFEFSSYMKLEVSVVREFII